MNIDPFTRAKTILDDTRQSSTHAWLTLWDLCGFGKDIVHPGKVIKSDLRFKQIPIARAAILLGVSRPNLSSLVNCHRSVSITMARKIQNTFNIPARQLLLAQFLYDMYTECMLRETI